MSETENSGPKPPPKRIVRVVLTFDPETRQFQKLVENSLDFAEVSMVLGMAQTMLVSEMIEWQNRKKLVQPFPKGRTLG